jgi:hypothetical protein
VKLFDELPLTSSDTLRIEAFCHRYRNGDMKGQEIDKIQELIDFYGPGILLQRPMLLSVFLNSISII